MKKVLIIDEMHPSIIPLMEAISYEVHYKPHIAENEVYSIIDQFDGLIVRSKIFIGKLILEKAGKLKFIARAGAGMDQIVEDEVRSRNITLINAPEGNRNAVAEHMMGMLLCLFNKIHTADREVRNGIWLREENRGYEISGKTIGIIGYGNNGKAFAGKFKGFDCEVLAHDVLERDDDHANENIKMVKMDEIFEKTDIISFHVPLTESTNRMVNSNYLSQFKKNVWLLNSSRGQVVVLKDLLDKINEGKVLGAALDVLENENLIKFKNETPDAYIKLMNHNKILLTPHVAGWTFESYERINQVLVQKISELNI